MKKYKTSSIPEGYNLVIKHSLKAIDSNESYCYGFYKDGTREPSLDGYYMKGDLIEITDKQEDNKALKTTWDFVEKYYPNYSSSDEICRAQDLHIEIFDNNNSSRELDEEYSYLMKSIYEEAINNFIQLFNLKTSNNEFY